MAKYVCTRACYPGRYCRVGDIVGEELYSLAPACFQKLESTAKREIEKEVKDLGLAPESETPQPIYAKDMRTLPPIAGQKRRGRRKTVEEKVEE